jgi:hypothetical protein
MPNERQPAPDIPGDNEAERMDNAVRKMFTVTKEDLTRRESEWKRARARKKRAEKTR